MALSTGGITRVQAQKQAKQLRRELARDLKARDRKKLTELRAHIRSAKQHKRNRLGEIVRRCRRARTANKEQAKIIRAKHRLEAVQEIERQILKARTACEVAKRKGRSKGADSIQRARVALAAEREYQRVARLYERPAKQMGPKRARRRGPTAAEQRAESDSQVEQNIPEDLVVVWRKVKHKIKASPRRTRTEAFLEWAAENTGDVYAITDEAIEADVAELVRQEAQLAREVARQSRYERIPTAELQARAAAPVPF